jgi:hypothetical protein
MWGCLDLVVEVRSRVLGFFVHLSRKLGLEFVFGLGLEANGLLVRSCIYICLSIDVPNRGAISISRTLSTRHNYQHSPGVWDASPPEDQGGLRRNVPHLGLCCAVS